MEEVRKSEDGKAKFVRTEGDTLFPDLTSLYFTTRLAGVAVTIDYYFFRDSLVNVWVHVDRNYWSALEEGVADFYTLMNALHARYDSLSSYYVRTDSEAEGLDTNTALFLGYRTYSATFRRVDGTEIHLYLDRAGYDDDPERPQKIELWFGIVNYSDPIQERIDQYRIEVIRAEERREEELKQQEVEAARAEGEKNAVDF